MTKINLIKPGLAALCVFFAIMWLTKSCDKPVTKPDDGVAWRDRVTQLQAQIATRDTLIKQIRQKRGIDSLENLRVSSGLKQRESALVRKLKQANADIKEIADSIPKVARYVSLADSTIAVKDSLYRQAVNHQIAAELSFRSEIAALADKNVKEVEKNAEYEAHVAQLGKENQRLGKRLERKKRGNRILLGVSAGLLTAVGVMSLTD